MNSSGSRASFSLLAALLLILTFGCRSGSSATQTASGGGGTQPPSYTGNYHPKGWIDVHPGQALTSLAVCQQCHEMTPLRTGSLVPSCMSSACHHAPVPGWAVPGSHGLRAKAAQTAAGGGLVACQMCHGTNFAGGASGMACASCHGVKAPHPAKPWRAPGLAHSTTDPSNAPVCIQCHFPGSPNNPAGHPATPAPAGTPPGCFNNTGCHGDAGAPHALGAIWKEPTSSAFHGLEAKKDLGYCQSCHGTPGTTRFEGGAAPTKCSTCHTVAKAHSDPWHAAPVSSFPGYTPSHRNALSRTTACTICHDVIKGRTPPEPGAPSCFSGSFNGAGCHANGPGAPSHPVPFIDPAHFTVTSAGFTPNCSGCHAVTGTSPAPAAPLCTACHQAGSPLTATNCTSCHARPPAGTVFPNAGGKHAKHDALAGVTGQCTSCHATSDSMTQLHYDHANGRAGSDALRVPPGETAFLATFSAKAGPASFDPSSQTCSNMSCHGGVKTPGWQNGSIDTTVDAGCRQCHTLGTALGVPENNSPFSGTHAKHLDAKVNALCTDCHAMGNASTGARNHFKYLNTPQMEGPASDTIEPMGNRAYYQPAGETCGTFTCHGQLHTNFQWSGEAFHAVPFLGSAHTSAKQADFDTLCIACHAMTGTSTNPKAPLCTTCHQAGSPLVTPNCASCHAKPPSGTAFPNAAGRHAQHAGMTGAVAECTACHAGADSGTLTHYDHANARPGKDALRVAPGEVKAAAAFNAKAGPMTFDATALTCSNTSCHGGIKTPGWATGTIDVTVDAGCRQCHALGGSLGVPESNSLFSGLHSLHLGTKVNALCTECHGMANGTPGAANHFKSLDTPQMEGPASDTVQPLGNPAYYKPQGQTCGTFTCHGQLHGDFSWTGGAAHAVPFTGPEHLQATTATFNAGCQTCHGDSGTTSPMATAPTCQTCHTGGSPLTITACASCHTKPPAGTSFPNVAAKHAKHNALAGVTGTCATCHTGADTGSQSHYDHANARPGKNTLRVAPAPVAFTGFSAKAGAAAFDPASQTCSNTSCHGGITAPSWASGTIATTTDAGCVQCHKLGTASGVPESNSHYSGQHAHHLAAPVNAVCSDCHAMTNGTTGASNHFKFLGTSAMEGPAKDTVMPMGNGAYYQPAGQTCGTFTCHGQLHGNFSWTGGASHAVPFLGTGHTGITAATFTSSCSTCHADAGATSPMATAPTCQTCHTGGSPTTVTTCASCHTKPPTGAAFPNVAAKHAKHDALAGVTGSCATCHSGADTGSQSHYDHANARPGMNSQRVAPAPVAFTGFSAKAGAAAFNATTQTCSNTSCHGGLTAPSWATGSIAVNTDAGCVQCHKLGTALGVPENNSHYSGLHSFHLALTTGGAVVCSDCHSMTNGTTGASNHFKFLGTAAMEGPAKDTVMPMGNAAYYQPAGQTCGTFTCHGQLHGNFSWTGGAPHAVPFLGTGHTGITAATFTTSCATCHADAGATSPMATAPTCQTCHTSGSPTTVTNCASCHTKPPTGAAFPNVAAKHAKHDALAGVTGTCATCHTGSDTGSQTHYDHANARTGKNSLRVAPAPVAFTGFSAKAGAAAFNPTTQTCSNTSCHGGVTAPSWATGSIAVNTDAGCVQCHKLGTAVGVPENNSHYSGLHAFHLAVTTGGQVVCSECHSMTNGTTGASNHFKFLGTAAMEGPAKDTVMPLGNAAYYQPAGQTCGTFTCHGQVHNGFTWNGAAHAVPFLDAGHTGITAATFTSTCATCHADAGATSPMALAPTCQTCHTAGSPTTAVNCSSCHTKPPTGGAFPNIRGSHTVHDAFPGVTATCAVCHSGYDTGTQNHYDRGNARPGKNALRVPPAPVAFPLTTYNAKTGAAAFSTTLLTCSNVSCHGGQTTPNWQTGTLDVTTQCTSCHALGTTQYNSFNSGEHQLHVQSQGFACTYCHNMSNGKAGSNAHFAYLSTQAMEGPASDTIEFSAASGATGAKTYNAATGQCTLSCHGTNHNPKTW